METRQAIYINGAYVKPDSDELIDVIDSDTEEVFARIPRATATDVDKAVCAAKDALNEWQSTSVEERSKYLTRISEGLQARMSDIANVISKEVGTPNMLSQMIQAGLPISTFGSMSQICNEIHWEERIGNSLVLKEPVGVVAAITPWNYPLHQIAAKVAPALLAGCTVVLKPAELAPVNAFILADVIDEIGLPPGVFNLVTGSGRQIGEALISHPDVNMISFTGSTEVGRHISEVAAKDIKRVGLELGGKSATVILPDADLRAAVNGGLFMCYLNSGQTCIAQTRMVVPEEKLGEIEEIVVSETAQYKVGSPFDPSTRVGPLVSRAQQDRVLEYIHIGQSEGAKLISGSDKPSAGFEKGFYVDPAVFTNVDRKMRIAQEEIFGPVLSIITYKTEEEAIDIANDSIYGLSGAVWAGTQEKAIEVAKKIRTGQVDINGGMFNPLAPFGGYKQSGHGRELGKYGVEDFVEIKSLQL